MNKVILGSAILSTFALTGCFGTYPTMFEDGNAGRFEMRADAAGMRAYSDGLNAIITNGKASPDIKSAAWQHREQEDKEITLRGVNSPKSFLQKFFGVSDQAEEKKQ